jgi:NAD(P)H-dependent FMN reductase
MTQVVAISGSLRKASFNTWLVRAAIELAPPTCAIELLSIDAVPLYDGDVEAASGVPPAVERLKNAVAAADGVLLSTPEYNGGIPGVLKNVIDWMSRPAADIPRVFGERPLALMGATPGLNGTRFAQQAFLQPFRTLGVRLWTEHTLYVAGARKLFDAQGRLVDATVRELVRRFIAAFAAFLERNPRQ